MVLSYGKHSSAWLPRSMGDVRLKVSSGRIRVLRLPQQVLPTCNSKITYGACLLCFVALFCCKPSAHA